MTLHPVKTCLSTLHVQWCNVMSNAEKNQCCAVIRSSYLSVLLFAGQQTWKLKEKKMRKIIVLPSLPMEHGSNCCICEWCRG
jgi:hypothetical protein